MAKTWMKFACANCNQENWLFEDIIDLKHGAALICCCSCGFVKGKPDKVDRIDESTNELKCLPFEGFERNQTRGHVGPGKVMTNATLWGTADGKGPAQGLSRAAYMSNYGFDPWIDWCSRHPEDPICQNDGTGRSFKDRCKLNQRPKETGGPVGGP